MGSGGFDGSWAVKCTENQFGTFSTPTFGGVGEPYSRGGKDDSRALGNQFTTNKQRGGQTGDNWNRTGGRRTDHKVLYDGEPYMDPHAHERKWKLEQKKKNLTPEGFKYSSPNRKNSGIGGNYGLIGAKLLHEPEYEVYKKGDPPPSRRDESIPVKQVVTSPGKKGYGGSTPGTLFGPGPKKGDKPTIGKEYEHSPEPYDMARQFESEERKFNQELLTEKKPYRTMSRSLDFFDGHKSVAAPKGITEDPRMPDKPEPPQPPVGLKHDAPFYPGQGPRSGAGSPHVLGPLGTFHKFPEHMADPLEEKMKAAREAAEAARITGGPWKPSYAGKTAPTKTVIFHEPGHEGSPPGHTPM